MRFTVSSSELLKVVLTVQKAIPAKASDAILNNYLFELSGNTLTVTASDKEITIRSIVEVDSAEKAGRIAVPSKQISDLLKELPDVPVTIATVSDNAFNCAWGGNGESTLPYYNPDDYPTIKSAEENATEITIPSDVLSEGIGSTVYACSNDEARAIMNSIFFDIKPESTTLVASDLQKLVCYTTAEVTAPAPCSFNLNKRHAAVLKAILGKDDSPVSVKFDDKFAVFSFGQITVICCLVVGKYPDYTTIIPKNNSNILSINRVQFLNTVRRISVCAEKSSNHVKLDLTPGSLEISAQDLGFEIQAHEKISCQYNGEDLTIGFKSPHLIDMLGNLSCETLVMKFADRRRSALIMPSPEEEQNENVFGIIMPVMVR